jgi:hypothetical protein
MKIGLLHLTDIHFTANTRMESRMQPLVRAITNDFIGIENIFMIISGDIAFSGKTVEYRKAKEFISVLKQMLLPELNSPSLKVILVPGNHDCNFDNDTSLRKTILSKVNYSTIGNDNSVIDMCLASQDDFWNFYQNYNDLPEDKLFYQISEKIGEFVVSFHCLNTAWMSQLNENAGGLFFPVKKYLTKSPAKGLNVGVWHHPYNWFTPNTVENNKLEFEGLTESLASLHFFGHEHVQSAYSNQNQNSGKLTHLLAGEVFNEDKKPKKSGFQTVVIDLAMEIGQLKKYDWITDSYVSSPTTEMLLAKEKGRVLNLNESFYNTLGEIKIPLILETKKDLRLSDIFVFPDLEISRDVNSFENYVSSKRILDNDHNYSVLDGESQVGKTSLLSMLFVNLYERGIYPIILSGRDINEVNVEKLVRRTFKIQYKNAHIDLDKYMQLPKEKRALLIDDFHDCEFNIQTTKQFFESVMLKFGKVVAVFDSANGLLSSIKTEMESVKYYSIKPLGYKKRNELIERYLYLKENHLTYDEHAFLNEVRETFENVQSVLGDKLMPPYPIYILSIVQALQYKPLKQNETSFGYCYQTLIHYSLHKAGVSNDDLDSYFNSLTELAFEFLTNNVEILSHHEIHDFYSNYSKRFICPTYDIVLGTLKKSKIIKSENDGVSFGYAYILYYLSAKKIADILNSEQGKAVLKRLFDNLHEEKNASILVFITHHSKDISFIESSLISLMSVLENVTPITLEKTDPYYGEIASFVQDIKNDIIENRNPKEEREKLLQQRDNVDRDNSRQDRLLKEDDDESLKKAILPFLQSFRSIEIVGQIIKNRRGSLEIPHLMDMLTELYTTAFRTIAYHSEILTSAKNDIVNLINEKISDATTKADVEEKVGALIQQMSLKTCLNVFSKLMQCVGNKELKKLYLDVAKQMDTPAAKIITFGINSYYGVLNPGDLAALVDEFKGNIVALRLLKFRVLAHVYHRNVDYNTKQKLASILDMTLYTKPYTTNRGARN